jgi:AGCS family alanine or glycine:cation symporter
VLVSSILKNPAIDMGSIEDGGILTTLAFDQIPVLGPVILVVGIISFAFSTVLGWSYYGERCIEYLGGRKATIVYRILFIAGVFVGAVANLSIVWNLADMMNALMAIPNLISLLLLSGVLVRETRYWLWEKRLDEYSKDEVPVIDK